MGTEEPLSLREEFKQLHPIETTSWDKLSWSTARQGVIYEEVIAIFSVLSLRRPAYLPPHHRHHSVTCSPLTMEPLSGRVSLMNAAAHRLTLKQ
jgi:hypothetical protein